MMYFSEHQLRILESALVREYNSYLDKRRKLRPSIRAVGMAEAKELLNRVRAEIQARQSTS